MYPLFLGYVYPKLTGCYAHESFSIHVQGAYFLSYKKFHDFPLLFLSFPWLIIHNSVLNTFSEIFVYHDTQQRSTRNFFIVIKFSMTFHNSTQNSMTFQAWKAKKKNKKFHDFPGFPGPVRTLMYFYFLVQYTGCAKRRIGPQQTNETLQLAL